jgi:hypothetical protein
MNRSVHRPRVRIRPVRTLGRGPPSHPVCRPSAALIGHRSADPDAGAAAFLPPIRSWWHAVDTAPGAMLCRAGRRRHKATARFGRRLADMLERRFPGWPCKSAGATWRVNMAHRRPRTTGHLEPAGGQGGGVPGAATERAAPKDCSRARGAFAWPQNCGRAGSALAVWPARRLTMAGFGK